MLLVLPIWDVGRIIVLLYECLFFYRYVGKWFVDWCTNSVFSVRCEQLICTRVYICLSKKDSGVSSPNISFISWLWLFHLLSFCKCIIHMHAFRIISGLISTIFVWYLPLCVLANKRIMRTTFAIFLLMIYSLVFSVCLMFDSKCDL